MKKIAYIRVSTEEQRTDRQYDGLKHICDELHFEKLSALSKSRPVYEQVITSLRPGDIFVIWDLDRAYRSARDALNELDKLRARGVEIQIANLQIDTSTPYGKLIYTFISGLAEFERDLLSQRTKEGMEAARKRGAKIGRPRKLSNAQVDAAAKRLERTGESYETVGRTYGVTGWTLSRAIRDTLGRGCEESPGKATTTAARQEQ